MPSAAEVGAETRADIRILGPTGMEDYYAHLLRLDRAHGLPAIDDRPIDAHCLSLLAGGAILVGAYVDGVMRAAAEIVPDRSARSAEAAITVEQGFDDRGFAHVLTERIIDVARRCHLSMLRVFEQTSSRNIQIADTRACALNG
jgi:hypothetical protein